DGHLDIAFGSGRGERGAIIYWGQGSRDYQKFRRTFIPDSIGGEPLNAADVNRDGYLDLLVPVGSQLLVHWGNDRGDYSKDRRLVLPTEGSSSVLAADFNRDGWLELVVPNYNTGTSRAGFSRVFWGGPEGHSEKRMTLLPTNGGAGSLAADFNRDGFLDLLIVCHRSEGDPNQPGVYGDHVTNSYIYWGSEKGFDPDRRLGIPADGPHYDYGVNLGNIYDRTYEFNYVSSPYACGDKVPSRIEWKGETPYGSRLKFQVRMADSPQSLKSAPWVGPEGVNTSYEYSGSPIRNLKGVLIQYRAIFTSPDGISYPVLESVSIGFWDGSS
ncbi:MAG: VCBS repeat-containing protein, partial [Acidobacteria bacterium]|nr:VCBS repeat-containing protein [Acidobacteriota bacterium]